MLIEYSLNKSKNLTHFIFSLLGKHMLAYNISFAETSYQIFVFIKIWDGTYMQWVNEHSLFMRHILWKVNISALIFKLTILIKYDWIMKRGEWVWYVSPAKMWHPLLIGASLADLCLIICWLHSTLFTYFYWKLISFGF